MRKKSINWKNEHCDDEGRGKEGKTERKEISYEDGESVRQ